LNISAVIATRNSVLTIGECLSSLMPYYQTGEIGQIIVVDGRSDDGTLEIIKNYPVDLMPDPGNGVYAGLDVAWRKASHELVMFIDSDACIGTNFLPALYEQFENAEVGIVGCLARAASTHGLGKTIGEWWDFHGTKMRLSGIKPESWSKKFYHSVSGFSGGEVYTSGPCFVVRRGCLQAADGFKEWLHLYKVSPGLIYPGDSLLSRCVIDRGWQARWWVGAPVYHHPPSTIKKLIKQRYAWGKGDGASLRLSRPGWPVGAVSLITRLGSPALAVWLMIRYRNTRHLIIFPLAQYAWVAGYLSSLRLNLPEKGSASAIYNDRPE
jgi:glycosyltransferase involved in cell wall biosynthesis